MALMKATKEGQVPMTAQEEAEIRAIWAETGGPARPKEKTQLERIQDLEARVTELEALMAASKGI